MSFTIGHSDERQAIVKHNNRQNKPTKAPNHRPVSFGNPRDQVDVPTHSVKDLFHADTQTLLVCLPMFCSTKIPKKIKQNKINKIS